MAHYPYNPGLPAPGKWLGLDFTDPRLAGAVNMVVRGIRSEVSSFLPPAGITLREDELSVWDGNVIRCYTFSPEGASEQLPAMLYCHGGGFFLPIQPMMMELAARYAGELKICVYLPEYRILPEYRNPYPFRDCLSVLEQITQRGNDCLLYGESAGGTLAAGLALWARDHGIRPPKGQVLIYPVMDNRCSRYPSMRMYCEAAWPLKNNLSMWRTYLSAGKDGLDDYLIPMQTPSTADLPMTYIEPQEIDTLRDEAMAYGRRLEESGCRVTVNTIAGSYHGFDANIHNPIVQSVISRRIQIMQQMLQQ